MASVFTVEEMILGNDYTEELYLTEDQYVVIKRLPTITFLNLQKQYDRTKDEASFQKKLVSLSLVEPKISEEQVTSLPIVYVNKMTTKILEINELQRTPEEVEKFRKN